MIFKDSFRISLLNTNYNALSEQKLIATLGDFQWQCISKTIGIPLSSMKTADNQEVYAAFYFVELKMPEGKSLKNYKLDDTVECLNILKGFKNISALGHIYFDHNLSQSPPDDINSGLLYPRVIFGNSYISPLETNEHLKMAPSIYGNFSAFTPMHLAETPHQETREAKANQSFNLFDVDWKPMGPKDMIHETNYTINPDRDSNGAGLVYFSNFISFMDLAERQILSQESFNRLISKEGLDNRTTVHRKITYLGNANLTDSIKIIVKPFINEKKQNLLGLRHLIYRNRDTKLICISECIKDLTPCCVFSGSKSK